MNLKTKLLGILIPLILIPILSIGIVAYGYLQHTALNTAKLQINSLTKQLGIAIISHLKRTQDSLDLLSKNTLIRQYFTADEESRYYILQKPLTRLIKEHQATYPEQYEIRLLLPDGYEDLRVSNQLFKNKADNESETPFFQALSTTNDKPQHILYINDDNRSPAISFSKPLILNNKSSDALGTSATFRGFLSITISPHFVTAALASLPAEFSSDIILTNTSNEIFLTTNASLPTTSIIQKASEADPTSDEISPISIQDKYFLIGQKDITKNIRLYTIIDTDKVLENANRLSQKILILSAITVIISTIILYLVISKVVTTPLNKLNQAALDISQGKLESPPIIDRKCEISDLSHALSVMNNSLKSSTQQIEELAYFDNLTGLPNKVTFFEIIGRLIEQSHSTQRKLAVVFFDLDNFKNINDGLGHQMGDLLLMQVGSRVKECLREKDLISSLTQMSSLLGTQMVSRMGGDEFALILSDINHKSEAGKIAVRILSQLSRPFILNNHEMYIGASIGLAVYPEDGETPETLLKHADIAMYEAKAKGKNNYQFFQEAMTNSLDKRISLETAIRNAIDNEEFTLHYQPKVSIDDTSRIEFEALIRWIHPTKGFISPADFIPIAEESGLIMQMGDWILNEACRQTKEWLDNGHKNIRVSINFSPVQINYSNPSNSIKAALTKHNLKPENIELEITESGLMQNEQVAIDYLTSLKELGVSIALDDFGTGYSSLAYLQRFPIDTLKIDRAFISDMEHNIDSQHVLDAIIFLAKRLQLETVAEGVETKSQLALIQDKGCKIVQGYYFSKPLPAKEAIDYFTLKAAQ